MGLTANTDNSNITSGQTLAGFGVAALQGIASYKHASAQAELEEAERNEHNKRVQSAMLSSFRSLEDEQDQTEENFIANDIDSQIMEARAKGAALADAGASGVGGTGVDMQLDDITVAGSMNKSRSLLNRQREMNHIRSAGKNTVNSANARLKLMPTQTPDALSYLLKSGVQGFRNTTAINKAMNSYDDVFGEAKPELNYDDLIDSNAYNVNRPEVS